MTALISSSADAAAEEARNDVELGIAASVRVEGTLSRRGQTSGGQEGVMKPSERYEVFLAHAANTIPPAITAAPCVRHIEGQCNPKFKDGQPDVADRRKASL